MPNRIKLRRSYTSGAVPTTSDLEVNEVAVNYADGKLYVRTPSNTIQSITLGGSGGSSTNEDTALRAFFLPPAPTSLTATAGNAQVSLSWTAPSVISQIPITDYVVQFKTTAATQWETFSDGTSTATSATVTGLTNGTAYTFRVAAVNGVGQGAYSTASSSVTPAQITFVPIPIMTSATAPSGVASESGKLTGSSFAWNAFDKATVSGDTTWYGSPSPATGHWMQYDFGYTTPAGGYTLHSRALNPYGSSQAPNSWTVSGSLDGTTFTAIETRSAITDWDPSGGQKVFTFPSAQSYRYWRWTWNSNPSLGTVILAKVQLTAP